MFLELYQIIFTSSIVFLVYVLLNLILKIYGRFILDDEHIVFELSKTEKIILWLAITILFSYLI